MENETTARVELLIRTLTGSPASLVGMTLLIHGSAVPELPFGPGVVVIAEVGRGGKVLVGAGVSVDVAVAVAVGMAAWVSAIIVRATAASVLWISSALTVAGGVACAARAPQALTISVITRVRVRIEKRFIQTSPYRSACFEGCSDSCHLSPEPLNDTSEP